MESHLSSIPADVSLGQVPPLNRRRLVAFFNCYIQKTTSLLSNLSLQSERHLIEMEKQMRVMDVRLSILERKVAEISVDHPMKVVETITAAPVERIPTPEPVIEEPVSAATIDDSICEKYRKMLKMGVPETAVKLKMQSEGVDPALLSADRQPASSKQELSESSDSSVEFSDSE